MLPSAAMTHALAMGNVWTYGTNTAVTATDLIMGPTAKTVSNVLGDDIYNLLHL